MKINNKFQYRLTDRLGTIAVVPLGEADFSIEYSRENDESKFDYKKQLSGKITFVGEAFNRLMYFENSMYRCDEQKLEVFTECNGNELILFSGRISLNSGEFNLDKCFIVLKFLEDNKDRCFEDNKTTKINVLQSISDRKTVKTASFNGIIETKNCSFGANQSVSPFEWCGNGNPADGKWTCVQSHSYSPDGVHFNTNNVWKREIIELDCSETPDVDFLLIEDNCATTGKKKYAKFIDVYNCQTSGSDPDANGAYEYFYKCDLIGYSPTNTMIDNGVTLRSVLENFIQTFCPQLSLKSDFFQINPDVETGTNYVTNRRSVVDEILMFQKSDVKRPDATGNAWKLEVSFEEILEVLAKTFNVKWRIVGNVFRLEHVSWFSKNQGIDVTTDQLKRYFVGKRIYTYQSEKIPKKEIFKFKEQAGEDWKIEIVYSGCVSNVPKNEIINLVDNMTTDVVFVMSNPDAESNVVEDEGFVLISTRKINGEYYINSESSANGRRLNNVFAWQQLFRDYWHYERPMKTAKVNGVNTEFVTTIPTKKGEKFAIPFPVCSGTFNPDDIVKTSLGDGIVESGTFRFKDCFMELVLLYEANQNLTPNVPPTLSGGGVFTTYKNVPKFIDIAASDPDGSVNLIQIYHSPSNGIVEILSFNQIRYTPNPDFVGFDTFALRSVDNISEFSAIEVFGINVNEANVAPVATNDSFNVYHGETFVQPFSILANDTDDFNSLQLVTTTATTSQGVSVTIDSNGFFQYTPPTNFEGEDEFQYQVKDDLNQTTTAVVTLNVAFRNRPKAMADSYQTKKNVNFATDGSVGRLKLTANDYTPDGISYTYTTTAETKSTSAGGSVTIQNDGNFTYIPPTDFTGQDSFTYEVHNTNGSGIGNVVINVVPEIFVKLVKNDLTITGNHQSKKQDYILYFYSDGSATSPINVDLFGFKVKIRQTLNITGYFDFTETNVWETSELNGFNTKILDDFVFHLSSGGTTEQTTITIEPDSSYQIIT